MIQVRNKNCVVAVNDNGNTVARAVRASHTGGDRELQHWYIEHSHNGSYFLAAEVKSWLPEVTQRKLVMAILKELS